ncbi:MAG: LytTR family transcriptional regulator [Prevotellaceae bacterium]|jgi:DNA-binding LytR/AlgR family response regulator|nr:LytTR family transcriptional regulator [Prevotellaceae bacterium]
MENDKIIIKERNKANLVPIDEITHIVCSSYMCQIYIISGSCINVSKLLKEFELELAEVNFLRINRCTLVNLRYINTIKFGKNPTITLCNNLNFKISRRKLHFISELLKK